MMHGPEKSDLSILATKLANKPGQLGAELVERRERCSLQSYCRAALNSRNCLQDDELLQLNLGILDSQCT